MALRSIGSSLLAKSNPGGAYRKAEEQNIQNPQTSGDLGLIARSNIEEPIARQVSPGSAKIVAQQPIFEGLVNPSSDLGRGVVPPVNPQPIGLEGSPVVAPQANNQALFQGNPQPQSQSPAQPAQRPSSPAPVGISAGNAGQVAGARTNTTLPFASSYGYNYPSAPASSKAGGNVALTTGGVVSTLGRVASQAANTIGRLGGSVGAGLSTLLFRPELMLGSKPKSNGRLN